MQLSPKNGTYNESSVATSPPARGRGARGLTERPCTGPRAQSPREPGHAGGKGKAGKLQPERDQISAVVLTVGIGTALEQEGHNTVLASQRHGVQQACAIMEIRTLSCSRRPITRSSIHIPLSRLGYRTCRISRTPLKSRS